MTYQDFFGTPTDSHQRVIRVGPNDNLLGLWKVWRSAISLKTKRGQFYNQVSDECHGKAYLTHLRKARLMYLALDKENSIKWGKNGRIKRIILEILLDDRYLDGDIY